MADSWEHGFWRWTLHYGVEYNLVFTNTSNAMLFMGLKNQEVKNQINIFITFCGWCILIHLKKLFANEPTNRIFTKFETYYVLSVVNRDPSTTMWNYTLETGLKLLFQFQTLQKLVTYEHRPRNLINILLNSVILNKGVTELIQVNLKLSVLHMLLSFVLWTNCTDIPALQSLRYLRLTLRHCIF